MRDGEHTQQQPHGPPPFYLVVHMVGWAFRDVHPPRPCAVVFPGHAVPQVCAFQARLGRASCGARPDCRVRPLT